ncbi:hypothetical protein [Asanoa iriomotensis]|uniref:Uncharacterized protein n=1 Tax=Asanoa iriomotensis TaxID=234613 RepID=A0ABQ4CAT1_9ACTN|nr:hypothetical protein [Asanoa iriomotensis]GIF59885.1 hypothetical protein Air01nite_59800 [Asanoa iriomotensis]
MAVALHEVFGISKTVRPLSYVDRGALDDRLRMLLARERHVVIHGDSKQGKSWLRSHVLGEDRSIVVQCRLDTTPETALVEALGVLGIHAELKRTAGNALEGTLEISSTANVSAGLLGKLGLGAKATAKKAKSGQVETQPVGRAPANLSWIAEALVASERRLVLEDFHYVSEDSRKSFAFILKALVDLGVYAIIIGIWPQDNVLPYYNGDLDGRVEDIHLTWHEDELTDVLVRGTDAMRISMSPHLRRKLVEDAYANVGLLQRLTEKLCFEEGMLQQQSRQAYLTVGESLTRARAAVAADMRPRYEGFAENFVLGMRRLTEGLEVYRHLLQELTLSSDADLLDGISAKDLHDRITAIGESKITRTSLLRALARIDRLQAKMEIKPIVLTYNSHSQRVFVVDRSFLFFRKYGDPRWPWSGQDFDASNDLAQTDPLDLN